MTTTWQPATLLPVLSACFMCGHSISAPLAWCGHCGFDPRARYTDAWSGNPDTDRAWR